MPELPEVETLRRELTKSLVGQKIKKVEVLWPKTVAPLSARHFTENLTGQKITGLNRRAKMLILNIGKEKHLAFHLKMTGQLIFVPQKEQIPENKHTRLVFSFSNGDHLYFNDLRKFGWSRLLNKEELTNSTKHYGPEPLGLDFTLAHFQNIFERYPGRTVKQLLLDQTLIAGIGNIYADEAAFLSGILPMRKAAKVSLKELKDLHKNIIAVLNLSIKHKGTSSRNYRRSDGTKGNFVNKLFVYGRKGLPCKKCGSPIQKTKHAGRGTHYCKGCQK